MEIRTITRRMKTVRKDIFRALLTRRDFEIKLEQLRAANGSKRPSVCASLCEMFGAQGISAKTGQPDSYYEELLAGSDIPGFKSVEKRIMDIMYSCFDRYPSPEEYMRRIVDRLSDPADGWQNDPLRLRILKQFVKYGDGMTYKNSDGKKVPVYGGEGYMKKYVKAKTGKNPKTSAELASLIDEGVFDALENANKDQLKPDGTYGLLKTACDLAEARFKSGGSTKRDLYMFAFVYDMTYYRGSTVPGSESETIRDYDSDIEKNLFEDYYTNNLMRFITDTYADNLNSMELDPSGRGINYKNFAEMVYIYYIAMDIPPAEKIKRSQEMIGRLRDSTAPDAAYRDATMYYSSMFTEDILMLPEDRFEDFIRTSYDCRVSFETQDKKGKAMTSVKSPMQVRTSQNSAFSFYNELIEGIKEADPAYSVNNCNYGLWFVDMSMIGKTDGESLKGFFAGKDREKAEQFIQLLYGINRFIGHTFEEEKNDTLTSPAEDAPSVRCLNRMNITRPEDMTRTALMTAYYYNYNLMSELNSDKKTFIEVYDDYTDMVSGLNGMLEDSGYQLISDKNIFDIALIFSSYAYSVN